MQRPAGFAVVKDSTDCGDFGRVGFRAGGPDGAIEELEHDETFGSLACGCSPGRSFDAANRTSKVDYGKFSASI